MHPHNEEVEANLSLVPRQQMTTTESIQSAKLICPKRRTTHSIPKLSRSRSRVRPRSEPDVRSTFIQTSSRTASSPFSDSRKLIRYSERWIAGPLTGARGPSTSRKVDSSLTRRHIPSIDGSSLAPSPESVRQQWSLL